MGSLENIFNDGEIDEVVETEVEAVQEEAADVAETTEDEPPAVEDEGSTTEPEVAEQNTVPIQALKAEREKRQAYQRQLEEFKAQQEAKEAPDIFEDQKAYTEHLNSQMSQAMFNERANMSEFYAKREFNDLDEKVEKFMELSATNPALSSQVREAVSPYHEIYDIVTKHEKLEQMQNIDEFEAKTRAEIEAKVRAELEAEMKQKITAKDELRNAIPQSLVGQPSQGSVKQPNWSGPAPLNELLND